MITSGFPDLQEFRHLIWGEKSSLRLHHNAIGLENENYLQNLISETVAWRAITSFAVSEPNTLDFVALDCFV